MAKFDTYQMVTDRICAMLEQGLKPWAQPWTSAVSCAWSGNDGRVYTLLNQMLLADPDKKYKTINELFDDIRGEWVTYNQAQARGGQVRKGEKGRKVVFFKMIEKDTGKADAAGNPKMETIPCLNVYTVFHIRQCDGVEQKYHLDGDKLYDFSGDQAADKVASDYISREGITFRTQKGNRAYYSPATDTVTLPLAEQFVDWTEYYSTLYHELTHSTGHEKRLNRLTKSAAFGDDDYSTEELVAEIGSASLMATLGIATDSTLHMSAAYIKNWLKALKNDKRMIVVASSRAEKAVKMILNIKEEKQHEG